MATITPQQWQCQLKKRIIIRLSALPVAVVPHVTQGSNADASSPPVGRRHCDPAVDSGYQSRRQASHMPAFDLLIKTYYQTTGHWARLGVVLARIYCSQPLFSFYTPTRE